MALRKVLPLIGRRTVPSIIEAVEFRRQQYGLTKRDWAKVIGLQPSHFTEFTQGKRNLTLKQAAKCFQYGVPAESLFLCKSDSGIKEARAVIAKDREKNK